MGPRKTEYADSTDINVEADERSSQGHMAMLRMRPRYAPQRILMYLGKRPAVSMPMLKALSMVLIASWQTTRPTPAKKAPARDLAL
jgi:hypothetical protein